MNEALSIFRLALIRSYKQILTALLSAVFFLILLFPYNDLSGLVTSFISEQTQNQVYLQFDSISPTLQPMPGVSLGDVFLESAFVPSLSIGTLAISPALSAITSGKPRGVASASGILGGDLSVNAAKGEPTQEGVEREQIELNLEKLDLGNISELAGLPINFKGKLSGEGSALADLSLSVQPEADILLNVEDFVLPPATVATPLGDLVLPDLKLNQVTLKGRLSNGQLIIEEGKFGGEKDEIRGTIKGNIALRLVRQGQSVAPLFGAYSFDVDLAVQKPFLERAPLIFTSLDLAIGQPLAQIKQSTPTGARYGMKVGGTISGVPSFRPLK